jgi:hypothetical protein
VYATLTFRNQPRDDREAHLYLESFARGLCRAMRFQRSTVSYVAALEMKYSGLGHTGVRKHWHACIHCPDHELVNTVAKQLWFQRHGFAKIARYDPARAGTYYIYKLIGDGAESFHEGLERLEYSGPADLVRAAHLNSYVPDHLKDTIFGEYLTIR